MKQKRIFAAVLLAQEAFRVHGYLQNGFPALAVRIIKSAVPSLSDLNAPPVLEKLAMQRSGLILVTGPAGSGKSTTLAAMVDFINRNKSAHIVTLEDPPEYRFTEDKSIISQRQVAVIPPVLHLACVRHCARTLTLL